MADHPHHEHDIAAMREIRDRMIEISKAHEAEIHNGEDCLTFRYGAVAYIAHCLGLSTEHAIQIIATISLYDHDHRPGQPARIHPHPEI